MLEREGNFVFFLRPRRFGKSLMLNVLQAYYDVNYAGEFDVLFKGLDVYEHLTPEHSKYARGYDRRQRALGLQQDEQDGED